MVMIEVMLAENEWEELDRKFTLELSSIPRFSPETEIPDDFGKVLYSLYA